MNKIRLILRWLFIPLWTTLFFVYLLIWYIQMSWYYFSFQDYWNAFLILWDKNNAINEIKNNIEIWKSNSKIELEREDVSTLMFLAGGKLSEEQWNKLKGTEYTVEDDDLEGQAIQLKLAISGIVVGNLLKRNFQKVKFLVNQLIERS